MRAGAENEVEWLTGKHYWSASVPFVGPESGTCHLCGLRREWDVNHGQFIYWVSGEFDLAPAPCVPRLERPINGLLTTREACDRLNITHATFINHSTRIGLRPAATLVRGNVYLWRFSQVARVEAHLKANGRSSRRSGSAERLQ